MKRSEKLKIVADFYETSVQGARLMIQQGFVSGAYAVKRNRKYTYRFEPEVLKRMEAHK